MHTDQDIVYSCRKLQAAEGKVTFGGSDLASWNEYIGLSSKHLLKARPTKVLWPTEMLEHFSHEQTAIIAESSIDKIFIKVDDLEIDEEEEQHMTSVFYYKLVSKNARVRVTLSLPIYLDTDAWENIENDEGEISITPVPESPVFHVPVANTDLSEALHAIFSLIEREDNASYDTAYQRLMELLTKSELHTPSVHTEIILRAMVRAADDHQARPDFSTGPDVPPYTVLRLPAAILANPSVTNSLAFERIKAQLVSTDILRKQTPGVMDVLFGG